jgi:8-amino-7-oxononanoate synthase
MDAKLIHKLNERIEEGTIRSLSRFEDSIDFCSNDYLGLARFSPVGERTILGSTGSRLISGNSREAIECEMFISQHFKTEAALVFNSGYDANLGFFGAIPQKGDTVIYDQLIHASVRDGIRLSHARSLSFEHNSLEDLEKKLRLGEGTRYVAIESLYSMDGDLSPISVIAALCKKYGAYLIVDEAHAAGVLGKGLVDELGLSDLVFARLITFGKAYGTHGAVIVGPKILKDFLINFARSFIYTTALPPSTYQLMQQRCMQDLIEVQDQLQERISRFRSQMVHDMLVSDARSPIQIVQVGTVGRTKEMADRLQRLGFAVKPIFSPTVPKGKERIRICLHAFNTQDEIIRLCQEILKSFNV